MAFGAEKSMVKENFICWINLGYRQLEVTSSIAFELRRLNRAASE